MTQITAGLVERTVQEVFQLNGAYRKAVDLDGLHQLGPPAPENEIRRVEAQFKVTFPPSYRTFLALHNGWKGWLGDVDLLSTSEMLQGAYTKKIVEWRRAEFAEGKAAPIVNPVIGVELPGEMFIFLDRGTVASNGEMNVIEWEFEEVDRYPSFFKFLEAKARTLKKVLKRELGSP